jgi:hypothetical protein
MRHQVKRARQVEVAHGHAAQQPGAALVLYRPPGDERDPEPGADRLLDRLRRAHLAHDTEAAEVEADRPQRALEGVPRARAALA